MAEDPTQAQPADTATPPAEDDTNALLQQILAEQQSHRAEVAALRNELDQQKLRNNTRPPVLTQNALSPEEAYAARMAEIADFPFYCPGCGRTYKYQRECIGSPAQPHPPIEVVSTDELTNGDPSQHTAAPSTET